MQKASLLSRHKRSVRGQHQSQLLMMLYEPISEEVKRRLLKPLLPQNPRPVPPPRPSRRRKRKAIVEEFPKALRTTADYQQEILDLFDVASSKKKLAFRQTPWAIGSFLRGWQMDVPKGHPFGADPKAFPEGSRPQIYNKLKKEIRVSMA